MLQTELAEPGLVLGRQFFEAVAVEMTDFIVTRIADKQFVLLVVYSALVAHVGKLGQEFVHVLAGVPHLAFLDNFEHFQDAVVLLIESHDVVKFFLAQRTDIGYVAPFLQALEAEYVRAARRPRNVACILDADRALLLAFLLRLLRSRGDLDRAMATDQGLQAEAILGGRVLIGPLDDIQVVGDQIVVWLVD